jgi:16S rRNA (guanine966-N2)-methyltransferase
MRIIAGKYKGLSLFFSKDKTKVRPTQDRVKESVFNIIQEKVAGAAVLDLFCGSGGIGMEAVSRNAKEVVLVDLVTDIAKKNIELLKEDDLNKIKIIRSSVPKFLKICSNKFDIVYLDPPWDKECLYSDSLKAICEFDILEHNALVICEHSKQHKIDSVDNFLVKSDYNYGDTMISILQKDAT